MANTTAGQNVAIGTQALATQSFSNAGNAWNSNNVAIGHRALFANQPTAADNGLNNTAIGYVALQNNTTGLNNVALGSLAGSNITTGNNNISIGFNINGVITGSDNIHVGGDAAVSSESATIRIGKPAQQSRAFIAGIRGITTGQNNAMTVVIDSNGQLGTVSSSRRYKEDIEPMADASSRIESLRPVTFRYKKPYDDGSKPIQFGLIAEEVAESFPELVVRNEQGEPETVKYQDLTPLLLNEVQKLKADKTALEAKNADLAARLEKIESAINDLKAAK